MEKKNKPLELRVLSMHGKSYLMYSELIERLMEQIFFA